MPAGQSGTELDDLNLHVKSPLASDLASRFGDKVAHAIEGYHAPSGILGMPDTPDPPLGAAVGPC